MRPKIADNVDAGLDRTNNNLHFIFVNSRTEVVMEADPVTVQLVDLMDGTRTIRELGAAVSSRVQESEIRELVEFLLENRIVRDASAVTSLPGDLLAFQRQVEFFSDFTDDPTAIQERLLIAGVGIIGLGTIGGMIAAQLCRLGVGHLSGLDPDNVSESNLARHALFTQVDIGTPKIQAADRALRAIRPDIDFRGQARAVQGEDDIHEMAETCDIVINCADQPNVAQTSEWVGRACMRSRTPHILAGGYRTHLGFLGPTVIPFESACWQCFAADYRANDPFGKLGWEPLASSRASGGSLMPLAGMVASVHAWEAVRILTGILPPMMTNRKAEINYVDFAITWYDVKRVPRCSACGASEHPE